MVRNVLLSVTRSIFYLTRAIIAEQRSGASLYFSAVFASDEGFQRLIL
jgi:hypothetical protein